MRRFQLGLTTLALCLAATANAGSLVISPGAVDFGNVTISGVAAQRSSRVVNHGSPTTIRGFTSLSSCIEFGASAGGLPKTLGDLDTLTINFTYDPVNRGPDYCGFSILDDNGVADQIGVQGVGIAPALGVDDTLVVFSNQSWQSGKPETLSVAVGDVGNEEIAAPHLAFHFQYGHDWSLLPIALPIPPNGFGLLPIRFYPIAPGTRDDWLTISLDNDLSTESNAVIHLQGTWSGGPTAVGEDGALVAGVRVEPTPTPGTVRLTCAAPRAGNLRVEVRDLAGRRVARIDRAVPGRGEVAATLRRGLDWTPAPGVYLVRVTLDRQTIGRSRIVVVR